MKNRRIDHAAENNELRAKITELEDALEDIARGRVLSYDLVVARARAALRYRVRADPPPPPIPTLPMFEVKP